MAVAEQMGMPSTKVHSQKVPKKDRETIGCLAPGDLMDGKRSSCRKEFKVYQVRISPLNFVYYVLEKLLFIVPFQCLGNWGAQLLSCRVRYRREALHFAQHELLR